MLHKHCRFKSLINSFLPDLNCASGEEEKRKIRGNNKAENFQLKFQDTCENINVLSL